MTKTIIAMLLAFSATPALAEAPLVATSIVETADLDLSSNSGQPMSNSIGRSAR